MWTNRAYRTTIGIVAVSNNGASEAFTIYEANDIWVQHGQEQRVNTCQRMMWLGKVRIFLDYKAAYSKDSECTELLGCFQPADAMHTKYPFEPITIYTTKDEVERSQYHLELMSITTIGES